MNIIRTTTLRVSLSALARDGSHRIELCAGHEVEVTDCRMDEPGRKYADETLCLTHSGKEVWIDAKYLA